MKIFHNKISNKIIIVIDNQAWSFYAYSCDEPFLTAKNYIKRVKYYKEFDPTCIEIEQPAENESPKLTEKDNKIIAVAQTINNNMKELNQ